MSEPNHSRPTSKSTGSPSHSATPTQEGGLAQVLGKIVSASKGLNQHAHAGILAGVLIVISILAVGVVDPNVSPVIVVIPATVCGTLPMLVLRKYGLRCGLSVFAFVLTALLINSITDARRTVEAQPVAAQGTPRGSVTLRGKVLERATDTPVIAAIVRTLGDAGNIAATDTTGKFELPIPLNFFHGDTISFTVRHIRTDTVTMLWENGPITVRVGRAKLSFRSHSSLSIASIILPASAFAEPVPVVRQRSPITVILDSIRTIRDGTPSATKWRFSLDINQGAAKINVPWRDYDDHGPTQSVLVGAETDLTPVGDTVSVSILGRRGNIFFGRQITGRRVVQKASLVNGTPFRTRIHVYDADDPQAGEFYFFVSVLDLSAVAKRAQPRAAS